MTPTQLRYAVAKMCRAGMPDREVAKQVGRSRERVKKIRLSFGIKVQRWSNEADANILGLAKAGFSLRGIAARVKRPRSTVHRRLVKLGVRTHW
jgi:IS30 family transposase